MSAFQQQIETACIKGGVATGLCGGFSTVFLSTEFWGILIGIVGAAAAWWGVVRRDCRERDEGAARLEMDREAHRVRMDQLRAGIGVDRRAS